MLLHHNDTPRRRRPYLIKVKEVLGHHEVRQALHNQVRVFNVQAQHGRQVAHALDVAHVWAIARVCLQYGAQLATCNRYTRVCEWQLPRAPFCSCG